jgi:hypothetical protein
MSAKESPRCIFGDLNGIVKMDVAIKLNFNGDLESGYVAKSFLIPGGSIYHAKSSRGVRGINVVVAEVDSLKKGESTSYCLHTFEGLEPMEMENLDGENASKLYNEWYEQVMQVVNPKFKVTPNELRKKLKELSKNQ